MGTLLEKSPDRRDWLSSTWSLSQVEIWDKLKFLLFSIIITNLDIMDTVSDMDTDGEIHDLNGDLAR